MGNPDVAKVRVAKAFWVAMAAVAGWNPEAPPATPSPVRLRLR